MEPDMSARSCFPHPRRRALVFGVLATLATAGTAEAQGEVNIYSYREPALIDPLLKAFTAKTGIKTNVVFAAAGLNERMAAEGALSPADMLLTADAGLLSAAKGAGVTQAIKSPALDVVPPAYRDAEGHWFGLTLRARVIYASKERVKQDTITYAELADPKWKGRICSRPGQHVYNTSLVATQIAIHGAEKTEAWLRGLRANLARKPAGGDREQVRDVHSGICDLAIGNTYYMGAMTRNPDQKAWTESVRIIFPDTNGRGTHVNVSGAAVAKHAKNKDQAVKLLEFLVSDEGQAIYAAANNEYPVSPKVPPSEVVQSWGKLIPDPQPIENIAKFRKQASELMDKVQFDQGAGG
jgi:iron(III) transport system substrate-binding protein